MKRLFSLLPALALLLAGPGIAAAHDHPCTAPEEAQDRDRDHGLLAANFVCGEVVTTLVPDANIEDVLERSAPEATVQANVGQIVEDQDVDIADDDDRWRMWVLNVPEGDEVATRDALRGDAEVEDAGLIYVAELTDEDGALPDTAMPVARTGPLTTIVGVLLMSVAYSVRRRSAGH